MQLLDHPAAICGHSPIALLPRCDEGTCVLDLGRAGGEPVVGRCHLGRVDEGLAVESHENGFVHLGGKSLCVSHVVVDAVQNDDASSPGSQDAQLQGGRQRGTSGHVPRVQLLDEVIGTHDEHGQPFAGLGDLAGVQHGLWGLDHGPDGELWVGTGSVQVCCDLAHLFSRIHLGYGDTVGPGGNGSGKVIGVPRGVHAVDAHDDFTIAVTATLDGCHGIVAGSHLRIGGNGVLQIDDDAVTWQ